MEMQPTSVGEMLGRLHGGELIALLAIVCAAVAATVISVSAIVLPQWRKTRQLEEELRFKQDLLAAGHSPDDVVRLVQATSLAPRTARRDTAI